MTPSQSVSKVVGQVAAEWRERLRKGERVDLSEYTAKYPEIADELRELFPTFALIEDLKADVADLTGSAAAGPALVGGKTLERLGDFRLLREIGRGGMGIVYEAEQESLGRRVALKVLPAQGMLDSRHQKRFQREAKAAARMHHSNIVPVYGVGEHEGLHYYVMQYIQGLGLDDVLIELKRLHQAKTASPAGDKTAGQQRRQGSTHDVSAVEVAESLLSGQFALAHPAEGAAEDPAYDETLTSVAPPLEVGRPGSAGAAEPPVADLPPPAAALPEQLPPAERPDVKELAQAIGVPPRKPPETPAAAAKAAVATTLTFPGRSRTTQTESGRFFWLSVARIGIQVGQALEYAHSQGVLHRDIKPSNLLLDTQGNVWVTDFGLAKAAGEGDNLTHSGDIVGTLRYMAPERFNGVSEARGDIYSLGLTLYELIAQRAAFEETDRTRLIKQVCESSPSPPRQFNAAIPRDLETIVLKAIDREPGRRYQTAGAFAEDLKRFVDDKPITARQVGIAERGWRWCRRNPALACLSAAVFTLLLAVAVGATLIAFHFENLAQEESSQRIEEKRLRLIAVDARKKMDQERHKADDARRKADQERGKAVAARREAENNLQLAEENFRKARTAVDDSLTRISESTLLNVPGLQPLRKDLLETALKYYQDFLNQRANDPSVQQDLATAYTRIGAITAQIGSTDKALESYQKAQAIRQTLLDRDPKNLKLQADLAYHHQAVGRLRHRMSDFKEALRSLQRASDLLNRVIRESRERLELLSGFASVHNDIGAVYIDRKEPLEAMSHYTAALKLQRQLVEENPKHARAAELKAGLARQLNRMGRLYRDLDLHTLALQQHREALTLLKGLTGPRGKTLPSAELRRSLAECHENIGSVQERAGKKAAALRAFQDALPLRSELARNNPAVTDYQAELAGTYFTLGLLQAKMDQPAAAAESYREAIARQRLVVLIAPQIAEYPRLLAQEWARLGAVLRQLNQPAEALRAYQEARAILEKLPGGKGGDLYELACVRAACGLLAGQGKAELTSQERARQKEDAARAVEALRQAVSAGFRDVEQVEKNTELDLLRPSADFRALLADLRKKAKVLEWNADLEKAKAQAAQEKKDLFIYFTGSDWCPWCLLVRKEVFGKDAFIDYVPRHFVLVELDFPQFKPSPKDYARNYEVFRRWGLRGFPSLILADSQGRAYANLRDRRVPDEPQAYIQLMEQMRANRLRRDEYLTRALGAEGLAKADLLDKALSLLPKDFAQADYGDAVAKILEIDPQNKAGLRTKYLPLAVDRRRVDVDQAMKRQDWHGSILQIDKIIAELNPTGKVAAKMWLTRARAQVALKHWDQARADFDKALALDPEDADLRIARGRFFEQRGQHAQAVAEFTAAIAAKTKLVKQWRAAFDRAPYMDSYRSGLGKAYQVLAEVQRKAGRPADAAATALERVKLWPGNSTELYNGACDLAQCAPLVGRGPQATAADQAQSRRYADQAMDLLRRAIWAGFTDANHIKADPDLDALHGRADYKDLVHRLERPSKFPAPENESRVLRGHTHLTVENVAFAPDSRHLLSSGYDETVRLWDVETGKEVRQFVGHKGLVQALAFSSDGRHVITGGQDNTVRLWDTATGRQLQKFEGHTEAVRGVALSPDGSLVLSGGMDKTLRLWDVKTGKEVRQFKGHTQQVMAALFVADGRRALSGGYDGTVRLHEVANGKQILSLKLPRDRVVRLALSKDGRRAVAGTYQGFAYVCDLDKGLLGRRLEGHWDAVRAVGFTPDGRHVVSGNMAGGLILSDVDTGDELFRFGPLLECMGLAVAPDGSRMATANTDGKVHLWPLAMDVVSARRHAQEGHAKEARAAYQKAVELRPSDINLRVDRARFFARQEQWDEAIADYSLALKTRADDTDLWVERGRCAAGLRRWDQVAADFDKALTLLPPSRATWYQLTAIWDELVQWDQAFTQLAKARPKDGHPSRARGRFQARRCQWKEAAAALTQSLSIEAPDDAEIWFEAAALCLLAGDSDGYRRTCARMLEACEQKKRPLRPYLVARACTLAAGSVADIKRVGQLAKPELMRERAEYWSLIEQAALEYRTGEWDQARKLIGMALREYPEWDGNVINWLWMAMAQQRLGQKAYAQKYFQKAEEWFKKYGEEMPFLKNWTTALHPHDWLEAHILFQEAKGLIKGKKPASPK
jgi:serine/threonine-protein kinase